MNRALLVLLVLLCGGCTTFTHPAVAQSGATFDPALMGGWLLDHENGEYRLEFRSHGVEGRVFSTAQEAGQAIKRESARVITAKLGGLTLLSVKSIDDPSELWSIYRYELDGDRLVVHFGDDGFWRNAVAEGLVEGRVDESQANRPAKVTVTASEKQLREVILGYGAVIFADDPEPEFVFARIR